MGRMRICHARRSARPWIALGLAVFSAMHGRCEAAQSPQSVVERYCWLDARGANFSGTNPYAKAIFELLVHEDEAAYDTSAIIGSWRIDQARVRGSSADVDVIYAYLGTLASELEAKKDRCTERVTFHLTLVNGSWRIDGLRMPPHISQRWMLGQLQKSLAADLRAGKADPKLRSAIGEIAGW